MNTYFGASTYLLHTREQRLQIVVEAQIRWRRSQAKRIINSKHKAAPCSKSFIYRTAATGIKKVPTVSPPAGAFGVEINPNNHPISLHTTKKFSWIEFGGMRDFVPPKEQTLIHLTCSSSENPFVLLVLRTIREIEFFHSEMPPPLPHPNPPTLSYTHT
jgi:hypothetical protein